MTGNSFGPTISIVIHIFIILLSISNGDKDYYCWKESERSTLKFKNNKNKNMTHLPTIRLIEGYYPSQFAMQYAAFVYLGEKMGINVTFYPYNDPNALFDRYDGYIDWCQDENASVNCSEYAPYPQFYFEDIAQDEYDLLFEIWDVMIRTGNGFDYLEDDNVTLGGISGVYGEGGWFVPKYVYDDNPSWILPQQLKYNQTLRQIFIDAYTIHSDINWIDEFWNIWENDLTEYNQYQFGLPNDSIPIIFGSYQGYAISEYSGKLINNVLISVLYLYII